jgi:hypothetical protein
MIHPKIQSDVRVTKAVGRLSSVDYEGLAMTFLPFVLMMMMVELEEWRIWRVMRTHPRHPRHCYDFGE